MASPEQDAWVEQVLDVLIPELEPEERNLEAPATGPVMPIWVDAKESLDKQVDALQRALKADPDEDLRAIGEFGLHGVTQGQSVRLLAALREADTTPSVETRTRAADAVDAFRSFLDGSPAVSVIERNPLGVDVPVRATLGPALDEIARTLGA